MFHSRRKQKGRNVDSLCKVLLTNINFTTSACAEGKTTGYFQVCLWQNQTLNKPNLSERIVKDCNGSTFCSSVYRLSKSTCKLSDGVEGGRRTRPQAQMTRLADEACRGCPRMVYMFILLKSKYSQTLFSQLYSVSFASFIPQQRLLPSTFSRHMISFVSKRTFQKV